ncbi:MAG: indole-3-glycerol phosphate synthase TrpC [Thermodesulfobacteriota bacterium]|nr:MAG: indole-3-glycerol phosphate synthase TrpC [Thermodesulfobacteriota bacterium]
MVETVALKEIIKSREEELSVLKASPDFSEKLKEIKAGAAAGPPVRDFCYAVGKKGGEGAIRIIAEVKKASPSKGVIRADFSPLDIARSYEKNGAVALSVLTEKKFFHGDLSYLTLIKDNVGIPVLRKDFILDEFQIYESRAAGADAVLLIVNILGTEDLKKFIQLTKNLSMTPLVEVHTEGELEIALEAGAKVIGINNRDLKTFTTDIDTTLRLAPLVPEDKIIISESGIKTRGDIVSLKAAGVSAFLVGESLMREEDEGGKLRELLGAGAL